MNKKLLCAALSSAMILSSVLMPSSMAADKESGNPDVYVNNTKIVFSDQPAQIVNDRTLVPARGVFEAMGNTVEWDSKDRTVTVKSSTGVTVVTITIDSDEMNVRTYKTIQVVEDNAVELDVPAQIMNDRTMIPLRAVSEAFNSQVEWDSENLCVNITTGEPARLEGAVPPTPIPDEKKVKVSLSTEAEDVKAGDEFTVYIDVDNFMENCYLHSITATLSYDSSEMEYISGTLLDDTNTPFEAYVYGDNPEYYTGCKLLFMSFDPDKSKTSNGHVFEMKFKAITDGAKDIALVNEYVPTVGYGTSLIFSDENQDYRCDGTNLVIDTTPITIGK